MALNESEDESQEEKILNSINLHINEIKKSYYKSTVDSIINMNKNINDMEQLVEDLDIKNYNEKQDYLTFLIKAKIQSHLNYSNKKNINIFLGIKNENLEKVKGIMEKATMRFNRTEQEEIKTLLYQLNIQNINIENIEKVS